MDRYIASAKPGFLPPSNRTVFRSKTTDVLDQFTLEARKLTIRTFQEKDERIRQVIQDENARRMNQYVVVLVTLALMTLVAGIVEFGRHRNHRLIRARARNERQVLEGIRAALQQADLALAARLDKERMDRSDREWIDSAVNSVLSQIKGTVIPDEIADTMVESLGRTLKVDFVVFYSYGKFRRVELWRQWSQTSATQIDFSRIAKYESNLLDFVNNLGEGSHAVVVSDSRLINI